jgi:hypothetical protein
MSDLFVSAHRFRVKQADIDEIIKGLIAALDRMHPADGASRVLILRGAGNSEVAVIGEWTSEAAAREGWPALYQSDDFQQILSQATLSESALYTVAAVREVPLG